EERGPPRGQEIAPDPKRVLAVELDVLGRFLVIEMKGRHAFLPGFESAPKRYRPPEIIPIRRLVCDTGGESRYDPESGGHRESSSSGRGDAGAPTGRLGSARDLALPSARAFLLGAARSGTGSGGIHPEPKRGSHADGEPPPHELAIRERRSHSQATHLRR